MLCREAQNYISIAKGLPFFYVVGDETYLSVLEELKQRELSVVHMSDFCAREDKFPSIDTLIDHFHLSDINYRENKFVVVGLGEYLALRGAADANKELLRLKNTTLGNARVILLLRGITANVTKIIHDDNKILAQQRAYISDDTTTNISITNLPADIGCFAQKGIKHLLHTLEDGTYGHVYTSTKLLFPDALFKAYTLPGAYSVVNLLIAKFSVDSSIGTEEQWQRLLQELKECNKDIDDIFEKYQIDEKIFDNLHTAFSGSEYKNWLVFLYLKMHIEQIKNSYLKLVLDNTINFADLKTNLMVKITEFFHTDKHFQQFYDERKKLLKDFSEADIAIFVQENEIEQKESIYRLTDNTMLERKTIVKWITQNGFNEALTYVYPALAAYLKKYVFDCPVLADELTEYFDEYKKQKLRNRISYDFIKLVEKYAENIAYTRLPTRDNAIKAIADKGNAYLYWLDALGVEYLSYISSLAKEKGLSMHTDIVRADLPTITTGNKNFFDNWQGGKKNKNRELDKIKHNEKDDYFFKKDDATIYIAEELDIINKVLDIAALELSRHNCKSFIIASDHGASRLAVINEQEVKYETDTKGEHSGRCCKVFDGCDLTYRVEENGFIVLTDYGRFKGSRAAEVEVHGGASLEEVVVPVITLTMKNSTDVQIKVLKPDDIIVQRHEGVVLHLYISHVNLPEMVSVVIDNKRYQGQTSNRTHYDFMLTDITRTKQKPYTAEIFDGEDSLGSVSFKVRGRSAKIKDDFDFDDDF